MTTTHERPDRVSRTAGRVTPEALAAEERRLTRNRRRFARRQRARRWLRLRPVLAVLLVVALVAGSVWLVFFSALVAVDRVEVEGTTLLSPAEVRRVADAPIGRPLARVDLDAIRGRVRALAAVESVEVTRDWPHAVVVTVTERVPVAAVAVGSRYQAVDADGVLFRGYARRPADLPLVGASTDVGPDVLREGAEVGAALPRALRSRVDHVQVDSVDDISLELRNGKVVTWGGGDQSAAKAEVLEGLLSVAPDATSYDVSVPGQPAFQGRATAD